MKPNLTLSIAEAKRILGRMNIRINQPNRTIVDPFIQKIAIRTENGFDNELIMGIKFLSSAFVRDVKNLITRDTKQKYIDGKFDLIRYNERDNWSSEIWKILRVCYDLVSTGILKNVRVSDTGIVVTKITKAEADGAQPGKEMRRLIRTESDLDELRIAVDDINSDIPTFQCYDGEYFKKSVEDRKRLRQE